MWDQLRGVMKDPDNNPFPGFCEAPIDFAPTFKVSPPKLVKLTYSTMYGNPYEPPIVSYAALSSGAVRSMEGAIRAPKR
jgi:hypothetical protein